MSCPECVRLWKSLRFGLVRRHRLNGKLAAAVGISDLHNFDALSDELTRTEIGVRYIRTQIEEHGLETGHNPISEPAAPFRKETPASIEGAFSLAASGPAQSVMGDFLLTATADALETSSPDSSPDLGFCEEKHRLLDNLLAAIRALTDIQEEQTRAVISGDSEFSRFEELLHMAQMRKDNAKYAWIAHVEMHRCGDA
jgi:hypothetical protein